MAVRIFPNKWVHRVDRTEIAGDAETESVCVQDVNMRVAVDARIRFASEELAGIRIDTILEGQRQSLQIISIELGSIRDPEIGVVCRILQSCGYIELLVGVLIASVEHLPRADLKWNRRWIQHIRGCPELPLPACAPAR